MLNNFEVILFYKYVNIDDPQLLMKTHKVLCQKLNLKGRIIIAQEGINGTLEGDSENTKKYEIELKKNPLFTDVDIKRSQSAGQSFPKLSIKVRDEIVSLHLGGKNFNPSEITGKYLTAEELHSWFESGKEFYIVDMRNYYEVKAGHFEGSHLFYSMQNFRDLPEVIPEIEHLKGKTVVTVCTGGIRCEKASGFLLKSGFNDVYQLKNGIHTYMQKYPNQHFKGKLYVFDGRYTVGFNIDSKDHQAIGECEVCYKKSENYIDYYKPDGFRVHGIVCLECIQKGVVIPD